MLETVVTEREERLKMAAEQERLKLATEQERLKLAAEQERLKMEFELEKLRMTSDGSKNPKHEKPSCYELTKTVPSFDSKDGDITLFLSLFERQAKRAQIDTKDWVSGLLMLMPSDIVQLIAKFKLSPEEFRKKFLHHQKNSEKSWREFTFEISNYFQEWIEGLKIDSFEKLKNLIITDQLKRRAPFEAKYHFLDEWTKLVSPSELADKLDEYELVRSDRKYETKRKQQFNPIEKYTESNQRTVRHKPFTGTWNARNMGYPSRNGEFKQMHKFSCYSRGLEDHTSRFCPSKAPQRGKLNPTAQGNVITTTEPKREDASTVLTAKINVPVEVAADVMELETVQVKLGSRTMTGIIDSGAQISVIREDFTSGIKYEGEGYIEISSAFGERETTPLRIFEMNIDDGVHGPVPVTCAVSKKLFDYYDTVKEELEVPSTDIEASIELITTEFDRNGSTQDSEETRTSFIESQMSDPTLSDAWEMARTEGNAYAIKDGVLTHTEYICGEKVRQVVLPKCKRDEVLRVAHEIPLAGHLGEQKTKQRIKYSFFWPEIKKDVKEFCQSCRQCQVRRAITYRDRIPIQPIVRPENPFEVWSVDCIGPLEPPSRRGHKFVICAVDICTRWAETIPVRNITAKTTCNVLLKIFTATGFPEVICTDQGTNFTDLLTKEFLKMIGAAPREVPHSTTGLSPYQMVYGRLPRGPLALMRDSWTGKRNIPLAVSRSIEKYLENLRQNLERAHEIATGNAEKNQAEYTRRYNLRAREKTFQVGEKVLILESVSPHKL
ncbi:Gypsy retrotransposon integrase-like protein 1 [Araneus ventricosus]|uniref:RNA-directed DNA polymerase n=1 Tax=Araneus ventricosus TaxID=182803 RepID=A0A4Y2NCT5_ARAVE|nr:Gypsy retrotransposon integrase-like protein 1 [Araneus ventricosus]